MIKLLAIDLDGTLLTSQKQLPAENIAAVQAAAQAGVKVVLCTGRLMTGVRPFFDQLGLSEQEYLIINNGCSTYETKDWRLLDSQELTSDELQTLQQTLTDNPAIQLTIADDADNYLVLAEEPSELVTYDASLVFTTPRPCRLEDLEASRQRYFEVMMLGERAELDAYQAKWEQTLADQFSVVRSQDYIYEILPQGASKATALAKLASKLGYTADQVMAIGDANNDIEMLTYAKHSVAMGNSPDHIKALAAHITSSNDEAGVARAIEEMVLKG
jgi:Cof subfamily protein (haloacid dehalogenase superfamily)